MTTLNEILREYGSLYLTQHKEHILPSHQKVIQDLSLCRTEPLGGQLWLCKDCSQYHYSYHSCKNRHCPTCMNDQTGDWIQKQRELLLPLPYFMATFTLPEIIRSLAHSNQKLIYNLLFHASAEALMELAQDHRFIGGQIGMIGVLQSWTRGLYYHPHIHYLIPGGGLSADGKKWIKSKENFLMHVKPLSHLFRSKFKAALKYTEIYYSVPSKVWEQEWVVHIKPVGNGDAVLKYLAPYIFRVALSNQNILSLENGKVTFRFKDAQTSKYKTRKLPALQFISLFLQHVLPRGFVKVRYFGFLATQKRRALNNVKELLGLLFKPNEIKPKTQKPFRCPNCGREMLLLGEFTKNRAPPKLIMSESSFLVLSTVSDQ